MKIIFLLILFEAWVFQMVENLATLLMNDEVNNCNNENDLPLDFSGMEFILVNDTNFVVNGSVIIRETITSPIAITLTTKKYDRGSWTDSPIYGFYPDLCYEMKQSFKFWHTIFEGFSETGDYPITPKTVYYFMRPINVRKIDMPANFYGRYKVIMLLDNKKLIGKTKMYGCAQSNMELIERS